MAKNSWQYQNAGEGAEQLDFSHVADGKVK